MKTTTLLCVTAAVTLSSIAASIGCSEAPAKTIETRDDRQSPAQGTTSGGRSGGGANSGGTTSGTNNGTTNNGTTNNGTTNDAGTNNGGPDGGTPPPGGEEQEAEACFNQCIAGNAAAVQMDGDWQACMKQCQDDQCADNCEQQATQACENDQAACQLLQQCDQKCFPQQGDEGGGQQQPGE